MNENCTLNRTVDFISKRWSIMIIHELFKGDNEWKRYSKIKNRLSGITSKVLAMRLRELEAEGIVQKRVDSSVVPIKSEYSLTDSGKDLIDVIQNFKVWALKWKVNNKECYNTSCSNCYL